MADIANKGVKARNTINEIDNDRSENYNITNIIKFYDWYYESDSTVIYTITKIK